MKNIINKTKGITLIALVITIVILIILATVTINAVFGENGLITKAQYAAFISEMNSVKEKVDIWMTSNEIDVILDEGTAGIPANGLCQSTTLDETERLKGEIGYYRTWQTTNEMPAMDIKTNAEEFNSAFSGELVAFPSGIQDLYYLNNEELGLSKNKTYLMDISTGMIYSVKGIEIEGVMAYSVNMAQALTTGINNMPNFSQTEAGATDEILAGNPDAENGFQIIADSNSNNIFKLYNNGDLYGKGVKGIQLNSSEAEMEEINDKIWQTFEVPSTIPGASTNDIEIYPGSNTVYVIDSERYLWAWGDNANNKLGLTQSQQVEYTGMEPVKLNVDGKKVKAVYPTNGNLTFVITETNEVYASGYNANGALGLGSKTTQVDEFTKVNVNNVENIYKIMTNNYMTLIWYKDNSGNNEFFATGTNRSGWLLSTGSSTSNYLAEFTKIYDGNIGPDIDSEIKDILWAFASVMILKQDGTIWQCGYPREDGTGGSGDIDTGYLYTFKQFPENFGTNVTGIYQVGSGRLITRINDLGELEVWGTPGNGNNLGITDSSADNSNKYWQIPIPEELKQEGIKEIFTATYNVYYLSNTGKVYVSGQAITSGLNLNSGKTEGIVYSGLDNIQTMYSTDVVKIIDSNTNSCQSPICFTGKDGKIYTTGNSTIVFRDKVLQKEWKLVASNVKLFDAKNTAYIDNNNNLYIAGPDSKTLGLGETSQTSQSINNYILHPDESIRGRVKEVKMTSSNTYVLTTDGELIATGYYSNNGADQYPGWEEAVDKSTFEKILENIIVFDVSGYSSRVAISNDGYAYGWGSNYGGVTGQLETFSTIPIKYDLIAQIGNDDNVNKILTYANRAFLLTESGQLFKSGNWANNYYDGGAIATDYFSKYTHNINLSEEENIIDAVGNRNNMLALTSAGRLFGYGYANQLGINDATATLTETMEIPNMTDVVQITKGNGFYIAVKSDGTVWGTGSNQYGVLGRWVGSDRNSPNSRYRTAYEWVECPELEI